MTTMSLGAQTYLVLVGTIILYVALPGWLLFKRQVFRAGLAGILVTFMPSIFQGVFWSKSAGNFGLLLALLTPLPLVLMALGFVWGCVRAANQLLGRSSRGLEST